MTVPDPTRSKDGGHPLHLVVRHAHPYANRYIAGGFLLVATNALASVIPWLMKLAVDGFRDGIFMAAEIGWIAMAALAMALIRTGSRVLILGASRRVGHDIRESIYAHLQVLPRPFYDRSRSGDLLSRVTGDVQILRGVSGPGIMNVVNTVLAYAFAVPMMARIDPGLAATAFIPYLVLAGFLPRLARRVRERTRVAQERLADLTAFTGERFAGMAVVRTYGQEAASVSRFEEESERYLQSTLSLVRARALLIPAFGMMGSVGTLAVLWIGGHRVSSGSLSIGDFVAAMGYLSMVAWPTLAVGWITSLFQRGSAAAARIEEILATEPVVIDGRGDSIVRGGGGLTVRNLHFAYGGAPVLCGLDLEIPRGTVLGVTGPVGSGKSTLISLISRMYPSDPGTIWLDGVDVTDLRLEELRRRVGVVPQEAFLFGRSIWENIAYGIQGEVSDEALRRAATMAGLAEIDTEFSAGFDTVVGERGTALSGGQRQRVSLARALAFDPDLLILDDPFSAVDAAKEEEILRALKPAFAGRSVLLVSHRLDAFRVADRICVLDGGKVAELGTWDALVDGAGPFAELLRSEERRPSS